MMPELLMNAGFSDAVTELQISEEPFAIATIVRTAGPTAAKPGTKAVLGADGAVLHGWLGGGCTRSAVKQAVLQALEQGVPQLISIAPEDLLTEKGIVAGDEIDGVKFAQNGCPSKGSIDIFIEPCLPTPELVVFGTSPVAEALCKLAPLFQWDLTTMAADAELRPRTAMSRRFVVVATQGHGDLAALKQALTAQADHVAFVGSHRKYLSLANKVKDAGLPQDATDAVSAPAGLDIGAVTAEEIALSILAELTLVRRQTPGRNSDG